MWSICKKELGQFFGSLTGVIAIIVFLLVNGLVLFVFPNNILDSGYATLDAYFELAPWILLFLIPAICMRSFADEYRGGTFEILRTRPLTAGQIVAGKFWGALIIVIIALLPTVVYFFTINYLASSGTGIDGGAAAGSYAGLFFLAAVFTAISIFISSRTNNAVIAFILSLIACLFLYYGFHALSGLAPFRGGADFYLDLIGIDAHYRSISRGVLDTRDLVYFASLAFFFLFLTRQTLVQRA
ncbi:MAG: gliding motility-associated ABC transporter permease subunit GldF [Chitinophagaceae bacterium]|nr:MAG: gliding motility-associated ABC transporter permease subunit GldF [Chitinophagaceae bacterium]